MTMSLPRPQAALAALRSRLRPVPETLARLHFLGSAIEVLDLYREYFPADFRRQGISWRDCAALGRACERFYILVDTRLFPCAAPWEFDAEDLLEMSVGFRLYTYCPWPGWWEEINEGQIGLEDFPLADLAILAATGRIAHTPAGYEEIAWDEVGALPGDWSDRLAQASARARGPLRHTAAAAQFLLKNSGNFWVDVTEEELGFASDWPDWSRDTVRRFAAEWKAARRLAAKREALRAWVGTDPSRAAQVKELIQSALTLSKRARVRVGAPLIETLRAYDSETNWADMEDA